MSRVALAISSGSSSVHVHARYQTLNPGCWAVYPDLDGLPGVVSLPGRSANRRAKPEASRRETNRRRALAEHTPPHRPQGASGS